MKLGRDFIIKERYLEKIALLIDDSLPEIRRNSYDTMLNLSEFIEGIEHILEGDILNQLVDKIIEEKDLSILRKVLLLIKNLLYGEKGTEKALKTSIISRLSSLLDDKNDHVIFINFFRFFNVFFNFFYY